MKKTIVFLIFFLFIYLSTYAQRIQGSIINMKVISDLERLRPVLTNAEFNKNAEEDEEKFGEIPLLPAPTGARINSQPPPIQSMLQLMKIWSNYCKEKQEHQ